MGKNFHFLRLNTFKSQRALQDSVRAFPSKFLINQSTGGYSAVYHTLEYQNKTPGFCSNYANAKSNSIIQACR